MLQFYQKQANSWSGHGQTNRVDALNFVYEIKSYI